MNKVPPSKIKEEMHKALLSGDSRTVKSCLDDGFNVDGRLLKRKGRSARVQYEPVYDVMEF